MKESKLFFGAILSLFAVIFAASLANSQEEGSAGGRREKFLEKLTTEQRSCLEAELGVPGEGERPSREAAEAAFTKCGVEKPAHSERGRGGFHKLSSEQKLCLKSQLGEPGSGERPSKEEFEAAFAECGIVKE